MADDLDARIRALQGLIDSDDQALARAAPTPQFGVPAGSAFSAPPAAVSTPATAQTDRAPPRFAKDADDRSIFVGGLPKVDDPNLGVDLAALFAQCGPLATVTVLRDRATQLPKGQAYIEFQTHEAAGRAVDTMNHFQFRGQYPLMVAKKRSNANLPGRGMRPPRGRGAMDPMQAMMSAMVLALGAAAGGRGGRGIGAGRGRGRGRGGPPGSSPFA
jgi:hypothetical protein